MNNNRLTLAILWTALLSSAHLPAARAAEIWSDWTTITMLYPASGNFFFNTAYANTSLSTCDGGTRWTISSSYPEYKTLVAVLTAAFMAGKEVTLNITVAPAACAGQVNRFVVR